MDGWWEGWLSWSECTLSCGNGGTRKRNRTCVGTAHGGQPCDGSATEEEDCFSVECPGLIMLTTINQIQLTIK